MNSEELELSLRTEFESYLKGVLAGMQQDVADFQKNFEAEFEKHRAQMDEGLRGLSERFSSDLKFDKAFTESVVEHLRLARDDGAQLSAEAFSEAQKLDQPIAVANYDRLRDAINDISGQMTQSAILKSLVDHVATLTQRGAFFIVKNDSFVCWRRFDRGQSSSEDPSREIQFPVAEDTLLADAAQSLATRDSLSTPHANDSVYLDALGFGRPDRMVAVPLTARGRGVAVLYTDSGFESSDMNVEAIESLVRVAGLTVELRAASAAAQAGSVEPPSYVPMSAEQATPAAYAEEEQTAPTTAFEYTAPESTEPAYDESTSTAYEEATAVVPEEPSYTAEVAEYTGDVAVEEIEPAYEVSETTTSSEEETGAYFEPVAIDEVQPTAEVESGYDEVETPAEKVSDFAFASDNSFDASPEVVEPEPEPVEEYAYATEKTNGSNGHSYEAAPEPVVEVAAAQPIKSRLSDRHVDLPIEVSEDERRLHNDARRFARLLVSEIKLYNEQKVNEGRDNSDLYDRLREAIDRSREMYEKRVQPQVAAKFDYFHYELVSNLAEGSDAKLGSSYPGSSV